MTKEKKQLKEKFRKNFYDGERFLGGEELWQFIVSEIITPYEKQLEQVERCAKSLTGEHKWRCGERRFLGTPSIGFSFDFVKYEYPVCDFCGIYNNKSQNTQTK